MSKTLEAELSVRPSQSSRREEIVAFGALINTGNELLTINLAPLSSPSLALEIVESDDSPVALPPPPVPGGETPKALLAPGQRYSIEYPGFVPQWTRSGIYRVRLRYIAQRPVSDPEEWTGQVMSEWVQFEIRE